MQMGLENSAEAGGGMRGAAEREMEGPENPRRPGERRGVPSLCGVGVRAQFYLKQ